MVTTDIEPSEPVQRHIMSARKILDHLGAPGVVERARPGPTCRRGDVGLPQARAVGLIAAGRRACRARPDLERLGQRPIQRVVRVTRRDERPSLSQAVEDRVVVLLLSYTTQRVVTVLIQRTRAA